MLPPTSADDRITRRFYDQDGLLRAELDAAGTLCETRYDAAGQPVMRIAYARPTDAALRAGATLAQLLPAVSEDDIVEQLVYDARGLLAADIDGEGYLTSYRYDGNGNRTETVRYAQALTSVVPGVEPSDLEGSFYELLRARYGIEIASATQTIEPTVTNEEESSALGVPLHSPAFLFERTSRDAAAGRSSSSTRSIAATGTRSSPS